MTNEQRSVRDWMVAFGQDTPDKPCIPSLEVRKLRAKLILEEAEETIRALGFRIEFDLYESSSNDFLIEHNEPEHIILENIADGCSDLKVVTEGTLVACGLLNKSQEEHYSRGLNEPPHLCGKDPFFDEVMRSNWTKLWTKNEIHNGEDKSIRFNPNFIVTRVGDDKYLVKDKDGKVIKSPSYSQANLQPIIDSL